MEDFGNPVEDLETLWTIWETLWKIQAWWGNMDTQTMEKRGSIRPEKVETPANHLGGMTNSS